MDLQVQYWISIYISQLFWDESCDYKTVKFKIETARFDYAILNSMWICVCIIKIISMYWYLFTFIKHFVSKKFMNFMKKMDLCQLTLYRVSDAQFLE